MKEVISMADEEYVTEVTKRHSDGSWEGILKQRGPDGVLVPFRRVTFHNLPFDEANETA